jgi:hypothetical protein
MAASRFFGFSSGICSESRSAYSLNIGSVGMNGAVLLRNLSRIGTVKSKSLNTLCYLIYFKEILYSGSSTKILLRRSRIGFVIDFG